MVFVDAAQAQQQSSLKATAVFRGWGEGGDDVKVFVCKE
jgi:hypothetical protein